MNAETCPLCHGSQVTLELFYPEYPHITVPARSCVECSKATLPKDAFFAFARRLKQAHVAAPVR